MLTCKDISKLISESFDRELPLRERMGIKFHLMMCSLCRTYNRQMLALRNSLHRLSDAVPPEHLSPEARERIKKSLSKNDTV